MLHASEIDDVSNFKDTHLLVEVLRFNTKKSETEAVHYAWRR